jgi:chromate reductase
MRVLGISGSLRSGSYNARLLRAAAQVLPPEAGLELWQGLASVPPYNEDEEGLATPRPVSELRRTVAEADAVLIATPEYNGSVPGQLKNALDWLSRPVGDSALHNKPVAVIGASTGMFGAVWAQAELRKVLSTIGARVVDAELPVARAGEAFGPNERLADEDLQDQLESLLDQLVQLVAERERSSALSEMAA